MLNFKRKQVFGELSSIDIDPSWFSIIPFVIDSPNPVPSPISLVEKNGSKSFSWSSIGIPLPESKNLNSTSFSVSSITTLTQRSSRSLVASMALFIKLMATCSISISLQKIEQSISDSNISFVWKGLALNSAKEIASVIREWTDITSRVTSLLDLEHFFRLPTIWLILSQDF